MLPTSSLCHLHSAYFQACFVFLFTASNPCVVMLFKMPSGSRLQRNSSAVLNCSFSYLTLISSLVAGLGTCCFNYPAKSSSGTVSFEVTHLWYATMIDFIGFYHLHCMVVESARAVSGPGGLQAHKPFTLSSRSSQLREEQREASAQQSLCEPPGEWHQLPPGVDGVGDRHLRGLIVWVPEHGQNLSGHLNESSQQTTPSRSGIPFTSWTGEKGQEGWQD